MKKIKLNKKKICYTEISTEKYLIFLELLNKKIDEFISEIMLFLKGYTDSHRAFIETVWDNLFQIAFFELDDEYTMERVVDSLFENDEEVNRKLNGFYFELSIIIPEDVINNFKYNFYNTLINEYKIDKNQLSHLEESLPYLFLIHLISRRWWFVKNHELQIQIS